MYGKHTDLIRLKRRAGWTYREVADALGCSPSTAASKLCGFCPLTDSERRRLEAALTEAERLEAEHDGH